MEHKYFNLTIFHPADVQTVMTKKEIGIEVSFSREHGIVREPSFIYDTSVEAFGSEGASIDDIDIGGRLNSDGDSDIFAKLAKEIDFDPVDPFQAGADSLHLGGDFDFNEEDTEGSSREMPDSADQTYLAFDNSSLRIPLSGGGSSVSSSHQTAIFVNMNETKRLSTTSSDGNNKISSTPEGESYFMAREESFIKKVHEGELQNMAVEVSDYFSLDSVDEELVVKPIQENPEAEIEIFDLRPESSLMVKPITSSEYRAPVSSFETIYDKLSIEEVEPTGTMTKEEILASIGDKFQGAAEVPEYFSSFDELCQFGVEYSDQSSSGVASLDGDFGRRWTAPAGTVEAPILEADEFTVRFQPIVERTSGHWNELEKMMGGQSGRQQG